MAIPMTDPMINSMTDTMNSHMTNHIADLKTFGHRQKVIYSNAIHTDNDNGGWILDIVECGNFRFVAIDSLSVIKSNTGRLSCAAEGISARESPR